ncbi:hypothetical protein ABFA07_003200 [Porites harrisoni]
MNEVKKSLETNLEEQINGVQNKLIRKVTDVRGQLMKDLTVKVEHLEKMSIQREVEKNSEENCNSFTWKITSYGEALRKARSGRKFF